MALNFRQLFKYLTPAWAHTGEGELVYWSLAWLKDQVQTRARDLVYARFPSRAGESALKVLGDDRGILRGRTELKAHYAQRLIRFRNPYGHRVRGNAWALLEQVSEYFGGIKCGVVDFKGNYHERSITGVETKTTIAWNWDGTPSTPVKARFWLILWLPVTVAPLPLIGDPLLWEDAIGTPGYVIGQSGIYPDDVVAIQKLFRGRAWKPHGAKPMYAIVGSAAADLFPAPDGTWDNPATRSDNFYYWNLHS